MRKKTLKYMIVAVGTLLIATRLFQQKAPAYDKCEVILDAGHGDRTAVRCMVDSWRKILILKWHMKCADA